MTRYFVCASNGDDNNNGNVMTPFKTIQHAANLANEGDIVFVQPGIYRERIAPVNTGSNKNPIIFKSIEKHKAIVRGSVLWKPSNIKNNIAQGSLNFDDFNDSSHFDGPNPFLIPLCVTPFNREGAPETKIKGIKGDPNIMYCLGQVFVNDLLYKQCPLKEEMENNDKSWYYNKISNILYINGINENDVIEITNQRRLFAPHKRNLKYIHVHGFVFERCGNQYPNRFWAVKENQQAGAVGTRSGKFWRIEHNIIRYANGIGVDWGNEGNIMHDLEIGSNGKASGSYRNVISNNIICDNGAAGTAAFMANRFEFTDNIVERNNNLHFNGKQRWESAGVKMHRPKNSIINNNIVRNNYCHGIWADEGAGKNSLFKNNIIINNEKSGIDFEIGEETSGSVVNNIFYNNECGIRFATSGGVLIAHNLFIRSKKCDIKTIIFKRDDKWDSLNVEIFYNLFFGSPKFIKFTPPDDTPRFLASRFLNYNTYFMKDEDKKFQMKYDYKTKINMNLIEWQELFKQLNEENGDEHSKLIKNNFINFQETNNEYKLNISLQNELPRFPSSSKLGCEEDYYNNKWEKTCICGPFTEINNSSTYKFLKNHCI